jgi:hypothetical protein
VQLIEEFGRVAAQLADVMARLEGTTFVKRLKAAARSELKVGEGLASIVSNAFGKSAKPAAHVRQVDAVAKGNDEVGRKISTVMDDLDAYAERRPQPVLRTVLEEMKELDVLGSLRQLTDDMRQESGLSIAQTEFWSDTLDRWADELVPPPQDGGGDGGGGDGPPPESLPPEVVLEAMLILEAETNLREETRVAEQLRPSLDAVAFKTRAGGLAAAQQALTERVDGMVEQLGMADAVIRFDDEVERMKREILPGRSRPPKFAREIQLFKKGAHGDDRIPRHPRRPRHRPPGDCSRDRGDRTPAAVTVWRRRWRRRWRWRRGWRQPRWWQHRRHPPCGALPPG